MNGDSPERTAARTAPNGGAPRSGLLVVGILLIAANLRASLTAVGPLLDVMEHRVGLSSGAAGTLNAVPLLAFAAFSPLIPWAARRLGRERVLLLALVLLAAGIVLRSVPAALALFAGTVVIGMAIAAGNVLLPEVIKHHFPHRLGALTGMYVTVMSLVAAVASGVAVPIAGRAPGGWQTALGCWAGLAIVAAAVWAPHAHRGRTAEPPDPARASVPIPWRSPLAWQVTLYMGLQSSGFYVMIAWLPSVLADRGADSSTSGWALFGYQVAGLVASLTLPHLVRRFGDQRAIAAGSAAGAVIGFAGLALAPGLVVLWVVVAGVSAGACLVTALTLIGMRAPDAAHTTALSGMAQSVGYLLAALGPVASGLLHEATDGWTVPLLALAGVSGVLAVTGLGAGRARHIGAPAAAVGPPVAACDLVLHGAVRDPDGAPVARAVLTLTDSSGHQVASDTTDDAGRYRLDGAARGDHLLIAAATGHHPTATHAALTGPATGLDITLDVRATGIGRPAAHR